MFLRYLLEILGVTFVARLLYTFGHYALDKEDTTGVTVVVILILSVLAISNEVHEEETK